MRGQLITHVVWNGARAKRIERDRDDDVSNPGGEIAAVGAVDLVHEGGAAGTDLFAAGLDAQPFPVAKRRAKVGFEVDEGQADAPFLNEAWIAALQGLKEI